MLNETPCMCIVQDFNSFPPARATKHTVHTHRLLYTHICAEDCFSYFIIYQFGVAVVFLFCARNFSFIKSEVGDGLELLSSTISIHRKHILFPVVLHFFLCVQRYKNIRIGHCTYKYLPTVYIIFFFFKQLSLFSFQHNVLFFFFLFLSTL